MKKYFQKNKLFFFIDNLQRFKIDQIFFLIKDRIFKKNFMKFVSPKYNELKDSEIVDDFIKRSQNTLSLGNNFINKKFSYLHHDYHHKIMNDSINKSYLDKLWVESDNFEIDNNFQRFHLFHLFFCNKNDYDKIQSLIINWINKHKKIQGLGWNSFNCSMRLINWFRLFSLLPYEFQFNKNDIIKIQNSIYTQIQHINSNIEHHIPGNHIILQYFSLLLLKEIFPNWNFYKENYDKMREKFLNELNNEYLDNGIHFEQSYHYHIQITLMCLLWLKIEEKNKRAVDAKILQKIKIAVKIAKSLRFTSGYLPMIGDNCFNFFNPTLYDDYEDLQKLAVEIFPDVFKNFKNSHIIKDQYIIHKSNLHQLIFDIGNIGLKCNPGHGHADLGNIIYESHDIPIFIDPGTRQYSNVKEDMDLKKTKTHNTLSINNEDQSKLWGFFRWAFLPKNLNFRLNENDNEISYLFEYDGFFNIGNYRHSRKIQLNDLNDQFLIMDEVNGSDKVTIFINFILHPAVSYKKVNKEIQFSVESHSWIMRVNGEPKINIYSQKVYPNYDVAIQSSRLEIQFNSVTLPFKNEILISYVG